MIMALIGIKGLILVGALGVVMSVLAVSAEEPKAGNPWVVLEGKDGPGKGKHIVFVTGDDEYFSEEGMPVIARILAERHGFKCTVLFAINKNTGVIDPATQDNIPGLEALDTADAIPTGGEPGTAQLIKPVEQNFTVSETVEKDGHRTDVEGLGAQPELVANDALNFRHDGAQILGTVRHRDVH